MTGQLGADGFTQAFARHGRALWVLACAWVGRSDADDLVQEVARVAWQRRDTFGGGDVAPWLATIARQLGANWRRKRRPEVRAPADLPEVAFTPSPDAWPFDVDRAGLSDDLARALRGLSETARACLLLRVVLDLGFVEIGSMIGVSENTAASHARRAREALRAALTPFATLREDR